MLIVKDVAHLRVLMVLELALIRVLVLDMEKGMTREEEEDMVVAVVDIDGAADD